MIENPKFPALSITTEYCDLNRLELEYPNITVKVVGSDETPYIVKVLTATVDKSTTEVILSALIAPWTNIPEPLVFTQLYIFVNVSCVVKSDTLRASSCIDNDDKT